MDILINQIVGSEKMTKGVMIAGTDSGSGKTTITLGLLKVLSKKYDVIPFKVGPDYIDTSYHELISKKDSYNLDIFMQGEESLKKLYLSRASKGDIAVVEGVMGLFDGLGTTDFASSAHVARVLNIPVILVVNAKGMAKSASALVKGYKEFDPRVNVAGVILNRVGGKGHFTLLKKAIEEDTGTRVLGFLPKDEGFILPEGNLGLISPVKLQNFDKTIEKLSACIENFINIEALMQIASKTSSCKYKQCKERSLHKVKIAIAKDNAFNFYYKAGLETLEEMGAELVFFSPLKDTSLPEADGIYLGSGPVEKFAEKLSKNEDILRHIRNKAIAGMPIFAEGGGMIYLCNSLDFAGQTYSFAKVFDLNVRLSKKITRFGYANVAFKKNNILGDKDEETRCHQFSYYDIEKPKEPVFVLSRPESEHKKLCGYSYKNCLGTLFYIDFYSDQDLAKKFIKSCVKYKNTERAEGKLCKI